jgi:hypothetical protein
LRDKAGHVFCRLDYSVEMAAEAAKAFVTLEPADSQFHQYFRPTRPPIVPCLLEEVRNPAGVSPA